MLKHLSLLLLIWLPVSPLGAHGDLPTAILELNRQIEQAPEDAQLFFRRALLYKAHGELDLALVDLYQALSIDPDLEVSHLHLARVYLQQNLLKFSIQHINHYIDKSPANPFAYQTRAAIFQKSGNYVSAVSDLRETIRLKNDRAIRPDDYLILAENILKVDPQNYQDATNVIQDGLKRLGQLISLQSYLLDLLLEQQNCTAALQLVDKIMEPFARKHKWLLKKAEILEMDGQLQRATYVKTRAKGLNTPLPSTAPQSLTHTSPPTLNGLTVTAAKVVRGPYLQSTTTHSTIIKWRTDTPTDSKIWYGTSAWNLNQVVAQAQNQTDHELYIPNLLANTTYYYAIGNHEGMLAGNTNEHFFKTAPETGSTQPVRAWILGDCGTKNNNARAVRDGYLSYAGNHHTDLILLLGDNAYPDGTDEEYQLAIFENMYEKSLIHSPLWSTPGNHDYHSASASDQTGPYFDIFSFPKNGEAGGLASGTEAYYSFDYSNIHFVSLDSHDSGRDPGDPMLVWLENDLAATDKDWTIVIFHHPPYSKGSHDSDEESKLREMRENVLPILETAGVDLVLSGHSHSYERSFLMHQHYGHSSTLVSSMILDAGDGRTDGDGAYQKNTAGSGAEMGAVYTVAGASGKVSSAPLDHPAMFFNTLSLGSVSLEVDGPNLDLKYIDEKGSVLDYFRIQKDSTISSLPSVYLLSPNDGAAFLPLQTITIEAAANDQDGTIQQVEFFVDSVSIGIDAIAPYSMNWTIPAQGNFSIVAKAIDDEGNEVSTAPNTISSSRRSDSSCARISSASDDAEEAENGRVDLTSSDLELGEDGSQQKVGMRFTGLNIPPGVQITNAYLQFTVDETNDNNPCELRLYGEDVDNANTFSATDHNISDRAYTDASVTWSPSDWAEAGEVELAQRSPNIATIIQEIVNRNGYSSTSAIAIIIEGIGRRTAEAFDGEASSAPVLCVEYGYDSFDCSNWQANIGAPCNDGDPCTLGDTVQADCSCVGTIQDSDGGGVCDANDLCPDSPEPGMACDDGDPETVGEIVQADCSCSSERPIVSTCSRIFSSTDDAEENSVGEISLTSSDLELGQEEGTHQIIGLRFIDLDIPQGAEIISAHIQFAVDQINNLNPCILKLYGQGDDNPTAFIDTIGNISNRTSTNASVEWSPADWIKRGDQGEAQLSPNISTILQEIVNRPGFSSNSAIVLMIDGSGRRTAESFDGAAAEAPELCVTYRELAPTFDCNTQQANINDPCDDGDACTTGDVIQADCSCAGTVADTDNDGICDANDLCNYGPEPGTPCDDGDACTTGDIIQVDCSCAGTIVDTDNDGICDANDLCNDSPEPGTPCDDGNPNTNGETIQADCSCRLEEQTYYSCAKVSHGHDDAEERWTGTMSLSSYDLELTKDAALQLIGMRFLNLNIPQGATILSADIQFTVDKTNDINPCELLIYGEASDNPSFFTSTVKDISSRSRTNEKVSWSPPIWQAEGDAGSAQQTRDISPIIQEIVNRSGFSESSSMAIFIEGIGRRTAVSFNGNAALAPALCIEYKVNEVTANPQLFETSESMPAIIVYPNPSQGALTLSFSGENENRIPIQIRDIRGQVHYQTSVLSKVGRNEVLLKDLSLPSGVYYLQMYLQGTRQTVKFINMK